jgi:HAMP domain-containing protein
MSLIIGGSFMLGIIGFIFIGQQVGQAMRRQLDRRSLDIATNLADGAAPHVLRGNSLELHALVTKYSLLSGVAYVAIRDRQGEIVAHSVGSNAPPLETLRSGKVSREAGQRELHFLGRQVFETENPILGGQLGVVQLGMWADMLRDEMRHLFLPLAGVMGIVLLAISLFSAFVVRRFVQPLIRLTHIADRVSMGELETVVGIESNDEIGDLALAMDRLRSSLRAAMNRLEHAR